MLLKIKYLPVLLCGLKSCPLNKFQTIFFDSAINSVFSKMFFNTKLREVILDNFRTIFNCELVSMWLEEKQNSFKTLLFY